jgi:phosphatidylserine decarboxylase
MLSRLFVLMQYLLPKYLLTALVYRLARVNVPAVKNALIQGFLKLYHVNLDEVRAQVPDDFRTFNDFFIRELKEGARPIDANPGAIVSPADGTLSQAGTLRGNRILQAKGIDYTLEDLLAADLDTAREFADGAFATIYLAPYNYHRVHAPVDGELVAAHYVPGDLFSVNNKTATHVHGLFSRNERLNLHFRTASGPVVVVLVGALNVGSISTPWSGEIRPRKSGVVETVDLSAAPRDVSKGDLLGWFNMGSTVILLLPADSCSWRENFEPGVTFGSATPCSNGQGHSFARATCSKSIRPHWAAAQRATPTSTASALPDPVGPRCISRLRPSRS